jgi:hypothetical protein
VPEVKIGYRLDNERVDARSAVDGSFGAMMVTVSLLAPALTMSAPPPSMLSPPDPVVMVWRQPGRSPCGCRHRAGIDLEVSR